MEVAKSGVFDKYLWRAEMGGGSMFLGSALYYASWRIKSEQLWSERFSEFLSHTAP